MLCFFLSTSNDQGISCFHKSSCIGLCDFYHMCTNSTLTDWLIHEGEQILLVSLNFKSPELCYHLALFDLGIEKKLFSQVLHFHPCATASIDHLSLPGLSFFENQRTEGGPSRPVT